MLFGLSVEMVDVEDVGGTSEVVPSASWIFLGIFSVRMSPNASSLLTVKIAQDNEPCMKMCGYQSISKIYIYIR